MEERVNDLLPIAATQFTTPEARIQQVAAPDAPVVDLAAALESRKRIELAMNTLSPRLRQVAEGIRDGLTLQPIAA